LHGFSIFQHSNKSNPGAPNRSSASRQALSSTNLTPMSRSPSERSLNTMTSGGGGSSNIDKRLSVVRSEGSDKRKKDKKKEKASDDLTQMMNRASNYMTLAYVKIPTMVLCLSYKGQGKRNIEDVHDLVFRMPTLEYRNKTWSNLDLALQLKKDLIRALIGHAGAIVGNKFSHHRPKRQDQSRLRELANKSTFMSPNPNHVGLPVPTDWQMTATSSETSSLQESSMGGDTSGRPSSARPPSSALARTISYTTSASVSTSELRASEDFQRNGVHTSDGQQQFSSPDHLAAKPAPRPATSHTAASESSRSRGLPLTRRLSGFGDRLRSRQSGVNGNASQGEASADDTEDTKRKSKILLGPQRLLGKLRD